MSISFFKVPSLSLKLIAGWIHYWIDLLDTMSKSAYIINSFLSDYSVSDIWYHLHQNIRHYSLFFPSHVNHIYSRIDYAFLLTIIWFLWSTTVTIKVYLGYRLCCCDCMVVSLFVLELQVLHQRSWQPDTLHCNQWVNPSLLCFLVLLDSV